MCGRYTLSTPGELLAELFELPSVPDLPPRYNIAPTQEVAAVRRETPEAGRELALLHWGLIPFWAKERAIGNRMINARADGIAEKPSFRSSFKRQRCLVLADGFYEWKKVDGGKQPWYVHLRGGTAFAFAGLWARWRDPESGESVDSCTLVTTTPNALAAEIHDRMPVILPRQHHDLWLDPAVSDRPRLEALLLPYDPAAMEAWPVSLAVNRPANDTPQCIQPTGEVVRVS